MRLVSHIDPFLVVSCFCLRCHAMMRQKSIDLTRQSHQCRSCSTTCLTGSPLLYLIAPRAPYQCLVNDVAAVLMMSLLCCCCCCQ